MGSAPIVCAGMGRDKGQAKGKAAATAAGAAAAPKASAAVQLSLRPDECPLCGHDVAVSEEQHILGTCGACGEHHYHTFCVQGVRRWLWRGVTAGL